MVAPNSKPLKPASHGSLFTSLENPAANASPGPVRMHKERSDPGVIPERVEQRIFTAGSPIASEQSLALAPTPAAGDLRFSAGAHRLDDKIRSVGDELAVYAENRAESAFHLGRRIVLRLEQAHRQLDQRTQRRHVRCRRAAKVK
jgi:hypothetical protein